MTPEATGFLLSAAAASAALLGWVAVAAREAPPRLFAAVDDRYVTGLATPAIVDNKIYLRTNGHLYCFGE